MVRKTREQAEQTRARILDVSKELFVNQGFAETSIAEICEACGVTKGALFHHFGSKEDLFRQIWTHLQNEMNTAAEAAAIAARSKTDPYASFMAGTRTYLDWASRRDYQQIVLIDGPSVLGMAGWFESDDNLGRSNTMGGMNWLARQGKIDTDLVEPLAILFHNALNGAGFAISRGNISADEIFAAFEVMLKSMRSGTTG